MIIIPRYLKDLTYSSWEPFKKRGRREVRKEGDLRETIMYCFFRVDGKMTRSNSHEIRLMLYWTVDIEVVEEISWKKRMSSA